MGLCSGNGVGVVDELLVKHHLALVVFIHLCLVVVDLQLVVVVLEGIDVVFIVHFLRLLLLHVLLVDVLAALFRHLGVLLLHFLIVFYSDRLLEYLLGNCFFIDDFVTGLAFLRNILLF